MYNMYGCLFLLALLIIPSALQQQTEQPGTAWAKLNELGVLLGRWEALSLDNQVLLIEGQPLLVDFEKLVEIAQVIQNATSQLLTDLQVLKGRQAVSGAVQGGQVFMFVAYLVTIAVLCLVKHCNKHRERLAQSEFELIEAKLQSNKAKRRAAAARAKSAQEGLPRPVRT